MPATTNRDLAEGELWELSLERSRRRRVLAANARKEQNRRKTASVAVTAAVAAAPMWPSVAGTGRFEARADTAKEPKEPTGRERVLLSFGDRSPSVAAVQRELRILVDGIFGPQTEAAVHAFQTRERLPATGEVDIRTWLAMFPDDAIVAAPSSDAGTGGEPQWAAVTSKVAETAPVAEGPVSASATPQALTNGPRAKAKPRKRTGARASRSRAADPLSGLDGSTDAPGSGGVTPAPPPAQGPAEGPPVPAGGEAPRAPQGAPAPRIPAPLQPVVPIAPRGSIGEMINAMVAAANRIDRARYPYRWGGGHNSRFTGPYDCSGAVSAVLHAAGLLRSPMVSGGFTRWGAPGRGLVTIYANASHVYMSIRGRYFGTSRSNPGGGAGWFRGGPRAGFVVVHVPFERMKRARSMARKRTKRPLRRRAYIRAPRPAPRQAPPVNRVTGGTPSGTAQPPASTTPTTTPTGTPPPSSVTPAPPAATPSQPAGGSPTGAPATPSQPINVETPAGSVTVTPPTVPPVGGGNPSGEHPGSSTPAPAAGTPGPAAGGPAPAAGTQGPQAPSAPPATPPASVGGDQPAVTPPPSSAPANPVGDAVDGAVAGADKAVDAVSSTLAPKAPSPAPDSGAGTGSG